MAAAILACLLAVPGEARVNVVYQRQDSLRIVGLLQQARTMKKKPASWMLWFGKQMAGVPYVGGTLDRTKEDHSSGRGDSVQALTGSRRKTGLTL